MWRWIAVVAHALARQTHARYPPLFFKRLQDAIDAVERDMRDFLANPLPYEQDIGVIRGMGNATEDLLPLPGRAQSPRAEKRYHLGFVKHS